jgi:hypothetical protein
MTGQRPTLNVQRSTSKDLAGAPAPMAAAPKRKSCRPDAEIKGGSRAAQKERARRIRLGLAIAAASRKAPRPMPRVVLARFCGVTDQALYLIERDALKKVRERLAEDEQARVALGELLQLLQERRAA